MRNLFYYALCVVLMLVSVGDATADLTDDLVVHFTFDTVKGKTIVDESGNGLDAKVIGSTQFVEGKYGRAIRITNETEDCVNVPNSHKLEIEDEITMMAWVYHENWKGRSSQWFDKGIRGVAFHSGYGMAVFDEKDLGGAGWLKSGSGIGIVLGTGEFLQKILVDNRMKDKTWHHIVGICERRAVKMYLDGKSILQTVDEDPNFKGINDEDLRIGCAKNRPEYAFEGGSIDEVAIWNRALSEDEVKAAMRGPLLAVSPKGKVATTWGNIKQKAFE